MHRLETSCDSDNWSKVRTFVLKTVALWTFLPLLYLERETQIKHLILIVDVLLSMFILIQVKTQTKIEKLLVWGSLGCITVIQAVQVFYIEVYLQRSQPLMYAYQNLVPVVAGVFYEFFFAEMMYRGIFKLKVKKE
jgi:hypothetical protein